MQLYTTTFELHTVLQIHTIPPLLACDTSPLLSLTWFRISCQNARPEDLSTGRTSYRGMHELIPTNHIDVIDAATVNNVLEIVLWEERDDNSGTMKHGQFHWRYVFNIITNRTSVSEQPC